jgi:alkaline phosphatase D
MLVWSGIFFGWILWRIQGVRIAFGSCSTNKQGKGALWPQLADKDPDHLILLGDNIYADSKITFGQFIGATPPIIESQYKKLEDDEGFNSVLQKISGWDHLYATWDDHDYGINNGDKSFKYRNESMRSFLEFFHQSIDEQRLTRGGVYTSSTINITHSNDEIFQVKILLLDTRFFKDPRHTQDGDFLGETQWKWLEDELLNDQTADVILLGSSIQILPTQKIVEESWSIFPHARERLLRLIALSPCLNVILLSGDVHMAEVSQVSCLPLIPPIPSSFPQAFCTPSHETDFKTGPQPRHLWEFTSSGLSHTFVSEYRRRTDKSPPQERHPRDAHNYLEKTQILSRGYLAESLFNMYQVLLPPPLS